MARCSKCCGTLLRAAPTAGVILLGLFVSATRAGAQESASNADALAAAVALERTLVETIREAEPSVVSIARIRGARAARPQEPANPFGGEREPRLDRFDPASPEFIPNEFGSGIIIAPQHDPDERLILTNYHVVRGGPIDGAAEAEAPQRLYVRFADRRGCNASIFAADPRSDLAVLKLETDGTDVRLSDLKRARIATGDAFRKGQLVVALGNPYALARDGSASASWGMISNISRRPAPVELPSESEAQKKTTIHHHGTLLQIDTRLNLGTSGGAVLNLGGEVIGVTTALAALDGYEKSVGYAIPFDSAVRRIVEDLCRGYEVEYGLLGVQPGAADPALLQRMRERTGLRQPSAAGIQSVPRNSPADRAGIRRGDLVLAVNGREIYSAQDLMRDVGQLPPGETADLKVWRPTTGETMKLAVELGKWPVHDDEGIIATTSRYPAWRGIAVDYPTARFKYLDPFHSYFDAVLVARVTQHAPAASAGLQEGDFISRVNRTPVTTPAEFHEAVRNLDGQAVTLQLIGKQPVTIPPDPRR